MEVVGPGVAGGVVERDAVAAQVDAQADVVVDRITEDRITGCSVTGDGNPIATVVGDDVAGTCGGAANRVVISGWPVSIDAVKEVAEGNPVAAVAQRH